ncbi:CHASE3 domain-containing protein [Bdellovibrio sp. SKB1291214]|uniref:CHASE3 domain-containing protein n=1 Tax=Bdellovibrio sp. SKB1291214 TaxID=1732569 RepID=UPI0015957401|nr:CHASE3 domain-containing protein [Bdellovibrio sp. SKB1291214]UYL08433.1 CHASE3 domain-containing protein [Bdellovibrio sp. SKB1291214]
MFGFVIATLGLIFTSWFLQTRLAYVERATNERAQIRRVAFDFQILKSLITDAETGQRGYLLTGNTRYLTPYKEATLLVEDKFNQLKAKLQDDPEQLDRLLHAERITNRKLIELKRTIDFKKKGQEQTALEIIATDAGQADMEDLRKIFDELESGQIAKIAVINGVVRKTIKTSKIANTVGCVFTVVLVLGLIFFLLRNLSARVQMEQSMMESNRSLERTKEVFSKVIEIQNNLSSSRMDIDLILNKVVNLSMDLTDSDGAIIEELDIDSGDLVYRYAGGAARSFIGTRIKARSSFSGLCLREQKPLMCKDSELDDRVDREACRKIHLRSMIIVPLYYGDELLGVLKNYSMSPNFYDDEVFKAFSLVSVMLSSSLGQAKEFEEKRRAIKELEEIREQLTSSVKSSSNIQDGHV